MIVSGKLSISSSAFLLSSSVKVSSSLWFISSLFISCMLLDNSLSTCSGVFGVTNCFCISTDWNEVLLSALSATASSACFFDDTGLWIKMVPLLLVMVSSLLAISFCCGLTKLSFSSESFYLSVGCNDSLLFISEDCVFSFLELFTFWLIGWSCGLTSSSEPMIFCETKSSFALSAYWNVSLLDVSLDCWVSNSELFFFHLNVFCFLCLLVESLIPFFSFVLHLFLFLHFLLVCWIVLSNSKKGSNYEVLFWLVGWFISLVSLV